VIRIPIEGTSESIDAILMDDGRWECLARPVVAAALDLIANPNEEPFCSGPGDRMRHALHYAAEQIKAEILREPSRPPRREGVVYQAG
jgi:hypothetical protein